MRVKLDVPFDEKDEAKSLGARWDPARKTWYLLDIEDLTPLMRWVTPTRLAVSAECSKLMPKKPSQKKPRVDRKPGVATKRTDHSLPDCDCTHIAPWEHCQHSRTSRT